MSIRLRLTLFYTTVLIMTLAAFGGVVYAVQSRATLGSLTETLQRRAERIAIGRGFTFERGWREPPLDHSDVPTRTLGPPDTYVQLRTLEGERVDSRSGFETDVALPLSEEGLKALQVGQSWTEIATAEGERLLIHSEPVALEGQPVEILQAATSLADRDAYLGVLRRNLLAISAAAVIIAFGAGWVLAGLSLRPIDRITQTAQAIGAERDLSRRVRYSGPNDEIGQLATTLNAMLTELQAAYQQQQQFVADVSHELRTPLTTIRGNLELLRRRPPISAEDRVDVLDDVIGESERLIRLVTDLLTLARAESRQPLRGERVAVRPLIEDACRQARLLDPARSITCDRLCDVAVFGDQDALKQVLLILLENALKHTDGPLSVATSTGDGHASIAVRDSGPGIEPEVLPHVFERFYRGSEAQGKPGVGLGLSIARALVEAQGGTIDLESHAGDGSVVTVTLPQANGSAR